MTKTLLDYGREIQAIAQSGLAFCKNPYDIERFVALRHLASEMVADGTGMPVGEVQRLFSLEEGYATPKLDVRSAVFRGDRLLLIKEKVTGEWTLPGGYIDVGEGLARAAEREVLEETGFEVRATKLAGVFDHRRHGYRPHLYHFYKFYVLCDLVGGAATPTFESEELDFFLPEEIAALQIDQGRTVATHVLRMFEHRRSPELPTEFD